MLHRVNKIEENAKTTKKYVCEVLPWFPIILISICTAIFWLLVASYSLKTSSGISSIDAAPAAEPKAEDVVHTYHRILPLQSGARCIDGSSPSYHVKRGVGNGARNWLVFFPSGGWCYDYEGCLSRAQEELGSSNGDFDILQESSLPHHFSSSKQMNPSFYDWNMVFVKYCDGGSFAGNAVANFKVLVIPPSFILSGVVFITDPRVITIGPSMRYYYSLTGNNIILQGAGESRRDYTRAAEGGGDVSSGGGGDCGRISRSTGSVPGHRSDG